jgi:probable HAF family extracellular repeat protein
MNIHVSNPIPAGAVGVVLSLFSGWVSAEQLYRLTELGTLGGPHSEAFAMNASGQVIGLSYTQNDGGLTQHAFFWDGTAMKDLGHLGSGQSWPTAISNSGYVTGWSGTSDFNSHAFLWDGSMMRDLGTFGGLNSFGLGINAIGQVVGYAQTASGKDRAFLWDGTT